MIEYGSAPKIIGSFNPTQPEMMFYLYMPIKIGASHDVHLEKRLLPFKPMIDASIDDFCKMRDFDEVNVYLTAKTMFVQSGQPGNREGWHADGFGSDGDINYIWCDKNPTQFAVQSFGLVSTDDKASMLQMEQRIDQSKIVTYPVNSLLRLDESVVHRVSDNVESGVRRFVKISFSRHIFNNEGNSHNYLFAYQWAMNPREIFRNIDAKQPLPTIHTNR